MGIGQGAFREVVKFSPPNPGLVTRGVASSALCVLGSIANDKNGNNLAGLDGTGRDGTGWDETGRDGPGRDGMERGGT